MELFLCTWMICLTTKNLWLNQAFNFENKQIIQNSRHCECILVSIIVKISRFNCEPAQPSDQGAKQSSLLRCEMTVKHQKVAPSCLFCWRSQFFRLQTALVCKSASSCIEIMRQNCLFSLSMNIKNHKTAILNLKRPLKHFTNLNLIIFLCWPRQLAVDQFGKTLRTHLHLARSDQKKINITRKQIPHLTKSLS